MPHECEIDLAGYRITKALEMIDSAEVELLQGYYASANNRAYYAVFHAMRSLLALHNLDYKKHSGVIAHFKELYIKSGMVDVSFSKIIDNASRIRNKSDYDDFYICSKAETEELLRDAKRFVKTVKDLLATVHQT